MVQKDSCKAKFDADPAAATYLAIGPWALVVTILTLLVPRVRRALKPGRKHLLVLVAVIGAAAAAIALIPDGKLPIPPGA